ncbi:Nn.00g094510.m01.CDS01 [Neocucurbitaria sp. VM-36]
MKPQKRSIRDFFSPISLNSQDTHKGTPVHRDASNAQTSHPINPSAPPGLQDEVLMSDKDLTPPTATNTSTIKTAPTATMAASTDTGPPQPSQNSANSGASKRIVSNGEQVVLNSDSDSDSLPELDWGEPKASIKVATPTTRSKRTSEDGDGDLRRPTKKERGGKRTFNMLVETAHKNMEIERRIIERKADLDKSLEEPSRANTTINEDVLGQVVPDDDDDPDKAHRLFLAMQRTNATQPESAFYFFEDSSDSISMQSRFPSNCLPKHRWASSFEDPLLRDQAFLTGFAYQIFRVQELPEELASWMIDSICVSRNEFLNERFLEILESHHEHLNTLLDTDKLNAMFKSIGANMKSLEADTKVAPLSTDLVTSKSPLPVSLKPITRLLRRAAPWLHPKNRGHALYILYHVCLDDRVTADADVLSSVQDAIEAIVCNFADNHRLTAGVGSSPTQPYLQCLIMSQLNDAIPQLLSHIDHPILQRNLICALPASSPLTAYLQRQLALSFLLAPTVVNIPLADPKIPDLVHNHLNSSPSFRINKDTDYGHLAARLTLLDIAIGPGFLSVPYQPLISPAPTPAGSSPVIAPFPISSEVKDFNKIVDALAQHIKLLGNSIVEAGAVVDLTILDAKDCVERLCSRLEHAVRIGGKKVHNIFDNQDEDKQLRVNKFFLNTRKVATSSTRQGGIFDEDVDGGVDLNNSLEA